MDSPGFVNLDDVGAFEEDLFGNAISSPDKARELLLPTPTQPPRTPAGPSSRAAPLSDSPLFTPEPAPRPAAAVEKPAAPAAAPAAAPDGKPKKAAAPAKRKPSRLLRPGFRAAAGKKPAAAAAAPEEKKQPARQARAKGPRPAPKPRVRPRVRPPTKAGKPAAKAAAAKADANPWDLDDLMDGVPSPLARPAGARERVRRRVGPLHIPRNKSIDVSGLEPAPAAAAAVEEPARPALEAPVPTRAAPTTAESELRARLARLKKTPAPSPAPSPPVPVTLAVTPMTEPEPSPSPTVYGDENEAPEEEEEEAAVVAEDEKEEEVVAEEPQEAVAEPQAAVADDGEEEEEEEKEKAEATPEPPQAEATPEPPQAEATPEPQRKPAPARRKAPEAVFKKPAPKVPRAAQRRPAAPKHRRRPSGPPSRRPALTELPCPAAPEEEKVLPMHTGGPIDDKMSAASLFELKLARALQEGAGMGGGSTLQATPDIKAQQRKPGMYSPIKKYERRQLLPDEEFHACSKRSR